MAARDRRSACEGLKLDGIARGSIRTSRPHSGRVGVQAQVERNIGKEMPIHPGVQSRRQQHDIYEMFPSFGLCWSMFEAGKTQLFVELWSRAPPLTSRATCFSQSPTAGTSTREAPPGSVPEVGGVRDRFAYLSEAWGWLGRAGVVGCVICNPNVETKWIATQCVPALEVGSNMISFGVTRQLPLLRVVDLMRCAWVGERIDRNYPSVPHTATISS